MTTKEKIKQQISEISKTKLKFKSSDIDIKTLNISRQQLTSTLKQFVVMGELLKEGGFRYKVYNLPQYADLL